MTAIICNPPAPAPSLSDSVTCEAVLLARTVPEETRAGNVSICSAWWQPTLGLIRVYPMPFDGACKAWRRYRLELARSDHDSRWRSFKLADGGPIDCVDTHSARDQLHREIERLSRETTIKQLNEKRDSLGVIRPIGPVELKLKEAAPDPEREFGRNTFEVQPYLHFFDADGEHTASLNEWGCYEWLRKGNDPNALPLRLNDPAREQFLLVGNLRDHPMAWVVIAVLGYTTDRPALFV